MWSMHQTTIVNIHIPILQANYVEPFHHSCDTKNKAKEASCQVLNTL